jgi:hypothetical protein
MLFLFIHGLNRILKLKIHAGIHGCSFYGYALLFPFDSSDIILFILITWLIFSSSAVLRILY